MSAVLDIHVGWTAEEEVQRDACRMAVVRVCGVEPVAGTRGTKEQTAAADLWAALLRWLGWRQVDVAAAVGWADASGAVRSEWRQERRRRCSEGALTVEDRARLVASGLVVALRHERGLVPDMVEGGPL